MFREAAGMFEANGTYGLGVLTADFDNDGWPDIYVANDSTASALYQNKKNGKFDDVAMEAGCALSAGRQAAGRHGSFGRRLRPRRQSRHRENKFRRRHAFALSQPRRNGNFEDATFAAGLGGTRNISAGAAAFSTWTTMAGPTF